MTAPFSTSQEYGPSKPSRINILTGKLSYHDQKQYFFCQSMDVFTTKNHDLCNDYIIWVSLSQDFVPSKCFFAIYQ